MPQRKTKGHEGLNVRAQLVSLSVCAFYDKPVCSFLSRALERGVRDGERSAAFPRLCGSGARPVQRAVSSLFSVAPRFPFPSGTGSVPFRRGKKLPCRDVVFMEVPPGRAPYPPDWSGPRPWAGRAGDVKVFHASGAGVFEGAGKGGNAALFFSARFPLLRPAFLSRYVRFRTRGQRRSCSSRHSCTALARASRSGEKGRSRCSTR